MTKSNKPPRSKSVPDEKKKRPITIEFVLGPEHEANPTPTPATPADTAVKNDSRSRKKRLTFRF